MGRGTDASRTRGRSRTSARTRGGGRTQPRERDARRLTFERIVRPTGPYSLALCIRHASDATRHVRAGTLTTALRIADRVETASATQLVAARLSRERGIGPWTVGVVCLEGLGRPERGLVGDLTLVKLMSDLRGRWVEPYETAELLEPYGDWAGLASVYLGLAYARGLVPLPQQSFAKRPPAFFRTMQAVT